VREQHGHWQQPTTGRGELNSFYTRKLAERKQQLSDARCREELVAPPQDTLELRTVNYSLLGWGAASACARANCRTNDVLRFPAHATADTLQALQRRSSSDGDKCDVGGARENAIEAR
jgi:hypothetical protein